MGSEVLLEARGVSARLGGRRVLENIDLVVRKGQLVAILGPNGAGKSSLLRAVAGLLPFQGEVEIAGVPLRQLRAEARARAVSYVPQRSALEAPLQVFDVVAQGRYPHRRSGSGNDSEVERALKAVDLTALRDRRYTELSHGERRRVLIARALATGAPLVLLDEPSAGLDVAHALDLFHLLRQLTEEGRGLVVVLHALDEALSWANEALLLARGAVVARGPVREVVAAEPVLRAYGVELVPGGGLGYRRCAPASNGGSP